jgi:hypothetical protein
VTVPVGVAPDTALVTISEEKKICVPAVMEPPRFGDPIVVDAGVTNRV